MQSTWLFHAFCCRCCCYCCSLLVGMHASCMHDAFQLVNPLLACGSQGNKKCATSIQNLWDFRKPSLKEHYTSYSFFHFTTFFIRKKILRLRVGTRTLGSFQVEGIIKWAMLLSSARCILSGENCVFWTLFSLLIFILKSHLLHIPNCSAYLIIVVK